MTCKPQMIFFLVTDGALERYPIFLNDYMYKALKENDHGVWQGILHVVQERAFADEDGLS